VNVGPSGSVIDSDLRFDSRLGMGDEIIPFVLDTHTYSSFSADSVNGTVTVSFIDDLGIQIEEKVMEFNYL